MDFNSIDWNSIRGQSIMLNVDRALETILSHINTLKEEELLLLNSLGQIAAEDIYAEINVPGWDSATQDGYAVKTTDIKGASQKEPRILKVIDKASAGSSAEREVTTGTAIRIMTGAQIPPGPIAWSGLKTRTSKSAAILPG